MAAILITTLRSFHARLFPNINVIAHFNVLSLICRKEGRHCRACARKMVHESEAMLVKAATRSEQMLMAATNTAAVNYLRYDDPVKEVFRCNNHTCSNNTITTATSFRCQKCSLVAMPKQIGVYCSRECQLVCYQKHDQLHGMIAKTGHRLHTLYCRHLTIKSSPSELAVQLAVTTVPVTILLALLEVSYMCPQHLPALDHQRSLSILCVGCIDAMEGSVDYTLLFDLLKAHLFPHLAIIHITLAGPDISSKDLHLHSSMKYSICRRLGRVQRLFSVDGIPNDSYNSTTKLSLYSFIAMLNPNCYADMESWRDAIDVMLRSNLLVVSSHPSLFSRCSDGALYDDIVLQHGGSRANIIVKCTKNPVFGDAHCYINTDDGLSGKGSSKGSSGGITTSTDLQTHTGGSATTCRALLDTTIHHAKNSNNNRSIFNVLNIPIPNMYYCAMRGCDTIATKGLLPAPSINASQSDHLLPLFRAAFLRSEAQGLTSGSQQQYPIDDVDVDALEKVLLDMAEDISEGRVSYPSTVDHQELLRIAQEKALSTLVESNSSDHHHLLYHHHEGGSGMGRMRSQSAESPATGIVLPVRKWQQDRARDRAKEQLIAMQHSSTTGRLHPPMWKVTTADPLHHRRLVLPTPLNNAMAEHPVMRFNRK